MKLTKSITGIAMAFLLLFSGCSQNARVPNNQGSNNAVTTPVRASTATPIPTRPTPPSPDLSGETFTIYVISSTAEPFTEVTRVARDGIKDYANYRNQHGGIYGANLDYLFADVDGTGAGALSAFELFSEKEDALAILILAPVNQELYEIINEGDIPVIYFGIGALPLEFTAEEDHVFWLVPPPPQQLAFWLDYAVKHWQQIGPEGQRDIIKLNYITWPNPVEGEIDAQLVDLQPVFQEKNIPMVSEGWINPSPNSSATNQILDGVFFGSTMIYTDLFAYGPAVLLNDLNYLNLGGFFAVAGGSWSFSVNFEEYLTTSDDSQSFYTPHPLAWWSETENLGIQNAVDIFTHMERTQDHKNLAYLYSLAAMDLAVHGIELVLEEQKNAASVEVTPNNVYQGLSELDAYQVLGGLFTADFVSGFRSPAEMRIWKFTPGVGITLESGYLPLEETD